MVQEDQFSGAWWTLWAHGLIPGTWIMNQIIVGYTWTMVSDNGGIYLDTDILVLRPLDDLMNNELTLGRVTPKSVGTGVIMSRPQPPFVCLWLQNFRTYQPWPWFFSRYTGEAAHKLQQVKTEGLTTEFQVFTVWYGIE